MICFPGTQVIESDEIDISFGKSGEMAQECKKVLKSKIRLCLHFMVLEHVFVFSNFKLLAWIVFVLLT
jgi:hypothetical protein